MFFKGVDFFPHGTRLPIMEWRRVAISISWVLAFLALLLLVTKGLNYGIDFKGGSLLEVQSKAGPLDVAGLRDKLGRLGVGGVQIQDLGNPTDALIRVEQQAGGDTAQQAATRKVQDALGDGVAIRRVEVVGPAVSSELKFAGIVSLVVSLLGILLYVWFRFEWQFACAAVLALVHDVFITTGMFALLRFEFDLTVVAALLTLAGYSINDTVVVFDRIRDNLRKFKKMPLLELMNRSLNETLSRTVLTATTVFLAVLALYVFGTEAIHGFAFAMLFGIIIGTWSSIFVAAPFLLLFGVKREGWSGSAGDPKAKAAAGNA